MKTKKFLLLLPAAAIAGAVLAQGPLTPPGAPAPVMKSLDQIEPRTPISSLPFTISQSGSYYLPRSLSVASGDAITITANDVTLDLRGFTLSSTAPAPGSSTAVLLAGSRPENIAIRNGHIRGTTTLSGTVFSKSGFQNGIGFGPAYVSSSNLQVSNVNVAGVAENGINLNWIGNALVERCSVQTCSVDGITATIINHCLASSTGNVALLGRVISHSVGRCEGNAGSTAISGTIVESCEGVSNLGGGIDGYTITNSTGTSSSKAGILARSSASNCKGTSTTSYGIRAENASNCEGTSESNHGMLVDQNATNCRGKSTTAYGITARTAANCYGESTSGSAGLQVAGPASLCRGNRPGGIAISAGIAIGCTAESGTVSSAQKHLGTP